MSNAKTIDNKGEITPEPLSEHSPYLQAEFVESSVLESVPSHSKEDVKDNDLIHIPWHEEMKFQEDILQATDTLTFDRVFTKRVRPTRKPKNQTALDRLLTPWGGGALFCLLLANGLLTWSQFSQTAIPIASAPQPLLNLDPLTDVNLSHPNLVTAAHKNLSPENLSNLPTESLNTRPAIANLPPISPPVTVRPSVPAQVTMPPQISNSLASALLPPSLQIPLVYSPNSLLATNQLPSPTNQLPNRAVVTRLTAVNAPIPSQPTVAVNPSYSAPRSLSTIPLPPPPPPPTSLLQNPPAPSTQGMSPVPTISNNSLPATDSKSTASDQMLRQILNQQNTMETSTPQTGTEGFNQKTRKKLQTLYNQSQGVSTNSESNPADANNLVQELQQLNQPE
jgi:hypothetical protein